METKPTYSGPNRNDLMIEILEALQQLGGSGRVTEINDYIIETLKLSEEIVEFPHAGEGYSTEFQYKSAWARTYLKEIDYIKNSKRSVWVLTEKAENPSLNADLLKEERKEYSKRMREIKKLQKSNPEEESAIVSIDIQEKLDWRSELKHILQNINPFGFEKLTQLVLRESGFMNIEITRKTGDGGLDGKGFLQLHPLISEPMIFECKRYKDSVGSQKIRNFRGAMEGRAKKGLFITTGTFTKSARDEASRDGATPIDLIDGEEFIDLLKKLNLGVNTIYPKVEKIEIDKKWFEKYQ